MFSSLSPIPSFPEYVGPHKVGSSEFEIPISEIPSESRVPDEKITSIKFRAYYPTTREATSREPVYWLPSPQKEWKGSYASFAGAGPRLARALSILPNLLSYITFPAVKDAAILPRDTPYPVVIFSHGLGGNENGYSSILGNLASCGIICIAPEHRDGSCPISFAKTEAGESIHSANSFAYRRLAHTPTPEILKQRNQQLRVRLWELELLYTALSSLNAGRSLKRFSVPTPNVDFTSTLDLTPGSITWAGHSFGAATTVQFVKSIFYHAAIRTRSPSSDSDSEETLYTPTASSPLIAQITPRSPLVLLDLWTMPLSGCPLLWEKPLPCYTDPGMHFGSVVSVMSTEFTRYTDYLRSTKALLSRDPVGTLERLDAAKARKADADSKASSASSSSSSLPDSTSDDNEDDENEPLLFVVPQSAHLSQSDFGPLFPYLTRRFMKAENDPHQTIQMNVRAVLQGMRERGVGVMGVMGGKGSGSGSASGNGVEDLDVDVNMDEKELEGWDGEILRGHEGLVRLGLYV